MAMSEGFHYFPFLDLFLSFCTFHMIYIYVSTCQGVTMDLYKTYILYIYLVTKVIYFHASAILSA